MFIDLCAILINWPSPWDDTNLLTMYATRMWHKHIYIHVIMIIIIFKYTVHWTCGKAIIDMGVETLSQLLDICTYFHHSCPVPHILCIQFSFNLLETMSCMTGCFHTTDHSDGPVALINHIVLLLYIVAWLAVSTPLIIGIWPYGP